MRTTTVTVLAVKSDAVANVTNTSPFATRFARRSRCVVEAVGRIFVRDRGEGEGWFRVRVGGKSGWVEEGDVDEGDDAGSERETFMIFGGEGERRRWREGIRFLDR